MDKVCKESDKVYAAILSTEDANSGPTTSKTTLLQQMEDLRHTAPIVSEEVLNVIKSLRRS
jgi:hypothetical protein